VLVARGRPKLYRLRPKRSQAQAVSLHALEAAQDRDLRVCRGFRQQRLVLQIELKQQAQRRFCSKSAFISPPERILEHSFWSSQAARQSLEDSKEVGFNLCNRVNPIREWRSRLRRHVALKRSI
jgi:hypothetical protein